MSVDIENGKILKIHEVIDDNRHLLPIIFTGETGLSLESVNKWLDTRKIPDKREGLKEARMEFRGFENYKNMFSLSDQYWFRYKKIETWDKMNFFTNHYGQEQGLIFFEPWKADKAAAVSMQGPDLTTNGVLRKRWVQDKDKVSWLLKAGSEVYHQEPLSEVLASITLGKLNVIPFVEYELVVYGLQFCSKCQNFITAHTEFVPASHIYKLKKRRELEETVYDHFISMCKEYGIIGAEEYMINMIAVDHILCNTDRHLGNFGFIRDAETGKILGFAPLFDFGRAYWGGKVLKDKTSRYFSEMEDKCFKTLLKKIDPGPIMETENMEQIVEKYPEISEEQANIIKAKFQKVNKEIQSLKIVKKPGISRD